MLEKQRRTRLGSKCENAAGRIFTELDRLSQARGFGARDSFPAQDQSGIGEARPLQCVLCHEFCVRPERGRTTAPWRRCVVGLFVLARLRHGPIMPRGATAKQSAGPTAHLLAWYDRHARVLPWRAKKGERADPYRVWLSEIMLQQTTVQAVAGYYRKFLSLWPDVKALAEAPLDDVLTAWAGLGYYARARNLHKAAKVVAGELGGRFPATFEGLRALPGIGAYTAGAIAAIAYDLPEAAMDANAERVIARLFAVKEPLPKAKEKIRTFGQSLVPEKRAGDFAQALMDLGSAICTPKRAGLHELSAVRRLRRPQAGHSGRIAREGAKRRSAPLRRGAAFVARDATGAVLLVKRPEKGLLGSMMQPPLGPWTEDFPSRAEAMKQAPFKANWKKRLDIVRHGFTHFELEIEVYEAKVDERPGFEGRWVKDLSTAALPTVMRKIVAVTPVRD